MNWKDEIKKETPYPKSPSIDLTTLTKEQLKALGEAQQAIDEFISKFESRIGKIRLKRINRPLE